MMKFGNSLFIFNLKRNPTTTAITKRNLGKFNKQKQNNEQQKSFEEKSRIVATKNFASFEGLVFKRNMSDKRIRRELFLIEGEEGFDQRTLREKMTLVINRGVDELKERFYDEGVKDNLPKTWEGFKEFVVDFCSESTFDLVKKFKEETWLEYCLRLKDWAKLKNKNDDEIMKKIRTESLPKRLHVIFFSYGVTFDFAIERLKEMENFRKNNVIEIDETFKGKAIKNLIQRCFICQKTGHLKKDCKTNDTNKVKCFKCGILGHYSSNCQKKQNNNLKLNEKNKIDERLVKINGKIFNVIFDTGASENMLCSGALERLKDIQIKQCEKSFYNFDGSVSKTAGVIDLEIEYEGKKLLSEFNILENRNKNEILLSNNTVKILEEKECQEMPFKCHIKTKGDQVVSWNRPIRSLKDRNDFEKLINELKEKGIVEKSNSCWLNPVVLTRKKNGRLRFCVDFRRLNDLVDQDEYEIPKINELLWQLRDMKYFTVLDLKDGFFHVNIEESDKEKTTFYTGKELLQFRKMPQGYKNSPAIFQRTMNHIFREELGEKCLIYIDDILIFGKDKQEHDNNLRIILDKLAKYNFEENKEKRVEFVEKVNFLGFEIEHNKIKPRLERAQGIIDFNLPTNKKELQRFLGMINYDRMFLSKIADETSILYQMTTKEAKFIWTKKSIEAFNLIKNHWKKQLELMIPDLSKNFVLESDASEIGLGACLRQGEYPIAYASRSLSKAEKKYTITEKEVLASLWAMEKFRYFLEGRKFTLITDHKAMEELKFKKEFGSSRIHRWFERLENFQFDVVYKKGESLIVADTLSRSMNEKLKEGEDCKVETVNQIMELHEKLNHRKTLDDVLRKKNIKISNSTLRKILERCLICKKKDKQYIKTCRFVKVDKPGDKIGIDMLEISDNERIIMAIDYFSRKLFAKVLSTKEAFKIVKFLEELYSKFPFKSIITDNGKEFSNDLLKKWTETNKIKHYFSIPYYHKSNGRIERANRTIRTALKKSKRSVKVKLAEVIKNYNNIFHRGIGLSPNEAVEERNWIKVKENELKYEKEFSKISKIHDLKKFDKVLIKNESKTTKMDDEFKKIGEILKRDYGDIYEVKLNTGKIIKRHISQLRKL